MGHAYVRVRLTYHQRLATPLEGLVYQKASPTEPVDADDLVGRVLGFCHAHPEDGVPSRAEVEAAVASLFLRGFLAKGGGDERS